MSTEDAPPPTPPTTGGGGGEDKPAVAAQRRHRRRGAGLGTRNTHASSGQRFGGKDAVAAAAAAAARRGAKDDDATETNGKGDGRDGVKKESTNSTKNASRWWTELDDEACDPITLEPLRTMEYAPFALTEDGSASKTLASTGHMFDGAVLAEYVTSSKCFENPLTREPLSVKQIRALDGYLAKWKLKRFGVERAYNAAQKEKAEADANAARRSEEQASNMRREREELRATLAQTMFTSLRERASAERGVGGEGRRRREEHRAATERPPVRSTSVSDALAELQADGRFAFVDDDISMLRDVSLANGRGADARGAPRPRDDVNLASWGGWSRPSHIENRGNDFPELPGAGGRGAGNRGGNWVAPVPVRDSSNTEAFPSLAPASRANPTWGTFAPRQSAAERIQAIPRSSAANVFSKKVASMNKPSTSSTPASAAAPVDEATARRNKLAEAFGISKPDERPSMFAESSASAFTREQLVLARKHPQLVTRLESTLEDIVTGKSKRRVSMEPMNREMRELCHVVAELYGITSASFGAEPNRHIDFFAGGNKAGSLPSLRLSDAMLVDLDTAPVKGSLASKTRPEEANEYFEGYTKHFSKGEYETLALSFSDISVGIAGVKSSLREFSGNYVLEEVDDDHAIAHFWKHGTLLQASGKLGGGMRGKFKVRILEKKTNSKGKEPVAEPHPEEERKPTSTSTSARLFRASTSRSGSAPAAPVEGQAAIDEALNLFGF